MKSGVWHVRYGMAFEIPLSVFASPTDDHNLCISRLIAQPREEALEYKVAWVRDVDRI